MKYLVRQKLPKAFRKCMEPIFEQTESTFKTSKKNANGVQNYCQVQICLRAYILCFPLLPYSGFQVLT